MKNKHYFIPNYLLKFKCSMCGDCCKGWKIRLDPSTIDHYKDLADKDSEFKEIMDIGVDISKDGSGEIILKDVYPNGEEDLLSSIRVCPFYGDDGLCVIHRKFGIESLSDICKEYPRTIYETERGREIFLSFACNTAAQLLKNKEKIEFLTNPEGYDFVELNDKTTITKGDLFEKKGKNKYFHYEESFIKILQLREFDIETRFILLGLAVQKIKDGDPNGADKLLEPIGPRIQAEIKAVSSKPEFMLSIIKKVIRPHLIEEVCGRDFAELFEGSQGAAKFIEGYNKYYAPFKNDIQHIYENFFVNFIFGKKFYNYKFIEAYFLMIYYYMTMRFFIVCKCIYLDKEVDEDIMLFSISKVDRRLDHNKSNKSDILYLATDGECNKLRKMTSLIKL